ncbi:hypothetical protein R3W88_029642 [Solanum pinnatisectum]|uniref:Polyprotein protein n=1 Tax=Solanum pinnatisectum TaxID=50273 RepID=A0AAV9K9F5_9SOLN|nr:hypothetical protein R3W88_029642 [Solanum pinnatisectum]
MIERAITIALAPIRFDIEGHKLALDALTVRVEECEKGQRATYAVTALKADIVGLRRDVDELKSTDLSMLFCTVEIPEVSSINIPTCYNVPPATIRDGTKPSDADVESEAETDEEQLGDREKIVYEDLAVLEGAMFDTARQASLQDTAMVGSSGSKVDEISGNDAQTEGVANMQISPHD